MLKLSGLQLDDFHKHDQSEQTRKIYRYVTEAVRRIEERHQKAKKIEEIFCRDLLQLRLKLRECANKLIHTDPTGAGSRAVDIYWRKGIHDPVTLSKQLRVGALTPVERGYLQSHLLSGIGHYHHLLLGLAEVHHWRPHLRLDFLLGGFNYGISHVPEKRSEKKGDQGDLESWLEGVVHKCLVYLGDLARYRLELLGDDEQDLGGTIAGRYYQMALQVVPGVGLPYNQLATLAGSKNHGLDQVYYYLRAVTSQVGFEGSEANLRRVLEKNVGRYSEVGKCQADEMTVVSLIQLVKVLVGEAGQEEVTVVCQQVLGGMYQLLQAGTALDWLDKSIVVVLMVLQKMGSGNKAAVRVALCHAYLLALFSNIAGVIQQRVNRTVYGPDYEEDNVEEPVVVEEKEHKEADIKKKRRGKGLAALLRRRRAPNSGSSGPDSDQSDDEIFYSDEEDADDDSLASDSLPLSDSDVDSDEDDVIVESVKLPKVCDVVKAAVATNLLPSLNLFCYWLTHFPTVLQQAGPGSTQLWTNLAKLFNCLEMREIPGKLEKSDVVSCLVEQGISCSPLQEDWLIRGLDAVAGHQDKKTEKTDQGMILGQEHDKMDWSSPGPASNMEDGVQRLMRLAQWRNWLCQQKGVGLTWNENKGRATVGVNKSVVNGSTSGSVEKKSVMKHMAELWLREEVQQLQQQVRPSSTSYIVLDCSCLARNLHMVKRVVNSHKFSVIVPAAVVQELDGIKKTGRGAREAIRWLERELGRGNRWLRAQRTDEREQVGEEAPNRRDKVGWTISQVLECCNYLIKRGGQVNILTAADSQIYNVAENIGVGVEQVEGFMSRWRGAGERAERPGGAG